MYQLTDSLDNRLLTADYHDRQIKPQHNWFQHYRDLFYNTDILALSHVSIECLCLKGTVSATVMDVTSNKCCR